MTGARATLGVQRHDLLELTPAGRHRLCAQMRDCGEAYGERIAELFAANPIPVIVRRHAPGDQIGVGVSFPIREGDQRLRFATAVTSAEIDGLISPYAIAGRRAETVLLPLQALDKVKDLALTRRGNLGVYGAAALQLATGLGYLDDRSDLDLLLRGETIDALRHADKELAALESEMGLTIDVEVVLADGGAVKLKELCSQQKTVLVKSIFSVEVVSKQSAIRSLAAA